jgi:hypothetical protein
VSVNQTDAKAILDKVLSIDTRVWAISVIERNGKILAAKSTPSFKETFRVDQDGEKYGGSLAAATLSVVNEVKGIFGEAQIIITIHNNCKLMLLNISSYEILIGLALERSFNCEDDNFIEKIRQLIISVVQKPKSNRTYSL